MIDVFSWPTPNGHKIHIMLEECGLEYRAIPINLGAGDHLAYTPDQAATQVLAALAGNPTKDTCIVMVVMPSTQGHAGV